MALHRGAVPDVRWQRLPAATQATLPGNEEDHSGNEEDHSGNGEDHSGSPAVETTAVVLRAGDALVFDSRMLHRGLRNVGEVRRARGH